MPLFLPFTYPLYFTLFIRSIRAALVALWSPGLLWSVVQNTGWELSAGNNKNIPLGAGQSLDRHSLLLLPLLLLLLGPESTLPTATDAADSLCLSPAQGGHYRLSILDTQARAGFTSWIKIQKFCTAVSGLFLGSHWAVTHSCFWCWNPGCWT